MLSSTIGSAATQGKDSRLRSAAEISAVLAARARVTSGVVVVAWRSNELGGARMALAISKRHVGSAVWRNRARRVAREVFRAHGVCGLPVDLVVMSRAAVNAQLLRTQWRSEVASALDRLVARFAAR